MQIKILNITDNLDGSANLEIEYPIEFREIVRNYYSRKRCTDKLIEKFIIEGLENYINKYEVK